MDLAVEVFESEEEMTASMVRPLPLVAPRYVRIGQATYTPVDVLEIRGKVALVRFQDGTTEWEDLPSTTHLIPQGAKVGAP